jgi:hypothetical protein
MPSLRFTGYSNDQPAQHELRTTDTYRAIVWKPGYSFAGNQVIYASLPADTKDKSIEIRIEGINNDKIPFTFIKNITSE